MDAIDDLRRVVGNGPLTLLDVGANIGQTAGQLLREFPAAQVYSFDPIPAAVAALEAMAATAPRMHVMRCALGSAASEMELSVTKATQGSSLLPFAIKPGEFGDWTVPERRIKVPVRRLDEVCAELELPRADLLKIDTQGYDLEVLKGAGAMLEPKTIRTVLVEICFEPFYVGQPRPYEIMAFMDERGYRPVSMLEGLREASGRLAWADMLFA